MSAGENPINDSLEINVRGSDDPGATLVGVEAVLVTGDLLVEPIHHLHEAVDRHEHPVSPLSTVGLGQGDCRQRDAEITQAANNVAACC